MCQASMLESTHKLLVVEYSVGMSIAFAHNTYRTPATYADVLCGFSMTIACWQATDGRI